MRISVTNRRSIPGAEEILDGYFPVLDHGFIALKDYMGGDLAIEEAARMSYGAGTRKRSETRGLLRYLMRHGHSTPFEMGELMFHIAMPIFVARQWIRTRTASVNEYSGRYSLMPMAFYTPEEWRLQSQTNKQGSSSRVLWDAEHCAADALAGDTRNTAQFQYEWLCKQDVSRELARIDLPLSTYTQWVWKIDLHNLFRFLRQRCDPHAQEEVRAYANVMAGMVKRVAPLAFEAWADYQYAGSQMSRMEMEVLRDLLETGAEGTEIYTMTEGDASYDQAPVRLRDSDLVDHWGLSKREVAEFIAKLQPQEIPSFDLDLSQMREGRYFEERMNTLVPGAS